MILNPEMVILAREFRGLTQEELARKICVSQAKIARIEGGVKTDVEDVHVSALSEELAFPIEFFTQQEERIGFGSSAYFYRKKAELSAVDRKRIHGLVNLLRIAIKKFGNSVEIGAKKPLPMFDLKEYDGNSAQVAKALRGLWRLPDGPVKNLTALIESAGVIVVPCDFGTRAIDATSIRLTEMPPVIFINDDIPGDRWRFTLAHELAHLCMHDVPHELMEDEADAFAAEFLMPAVEMKGQFSKYTRLRLQDFANMKPYWKVSIASLIMRAQSLGFLDENQRRYLWMTMSKLNIRTREPNPIEAEEAMTLQRILDHFSTNLKYGHEDFGKLLKLNPPELESLLGVSSSGSVDLKKTVEMRKRKLRVVG
jgi:Zn-dependent peptidase ImmA (M78 family)